MHDRFEIHIVKSDKGGSVKWTILVGDYGTEDFGDSIVATGESPDVVQALIDVTMWTCTFGEKDD
jgi:hypothetical protein